MRIIGVQSRVSPFLIAVVLLLQLSPALATGQPDAQQATSQEPVEVTFTKWVTGPVFVPDNFGITEGRGLMEGFTGGDIPGTFVGEVLQGQRSANPALKTGINKLEAIYEVHDRQREPCLHRARPGRCRTGRRGRRCWTASSWPDGELVRGCMWNSRRYAPAPTGPGCPDTRAPADRNCLLGTIHIERAPKE